MPRGIGLLAALAAFTLSICVSPAEAQAPPATVIGPAGEPAAPAAGASIAGTSTGLPFGRNVWLIILAASPVIGWIVGSALRPKGPRRAPHPANRNAFPAATVGRDSPRLTALQWAINPLRKYAVFTGRAPRREYWLFALLALAASILAAYADATLGQIASYGLGPLQIIVMALFFLPGLAVAVRRLHDTGSSGVTLLFALLPIIGGLVLLVFFLIPGTYGPNRYGPPPVPQA